MLLDFAMLCFKLSSAHSMPLVFFLSSRVHHRRRQHHHHLVLGERDKCTFRFHEDESRSGSFVTHSFPASLATLMGFFLCTVLSFVLLLASEITAP
jgi:hypothetical protein